MADGDAARRCGPGLALLSWLKLLENMPPILDERQVAQIARLIQRDHAHHKTRRPRGGGRAPARRN